MSPQGRPSILSYLALVLLFGPMLTIAVLWIAFLVSAPVTRHVVADLSAASGGWIVLALGAGAACLLAEWFVLPLLVPRVSRTDD